jgi:hypothetical protein
LKVNAQSKTPASCLGRGLFAQAALHDAMPPAASTNGQRRKKSRALPCRD